MLQRLTVWLLILGGSGAMGADWPNPSQKGFVLDFGGYFSHFSRRSKAPPGFENKVSSISGYLRLRRNFLLGKKLGFSPALGNLLPWKSGVDGYQRKVTTLLDFTLTYPIFPWLRFLLGPGIEWNMSFSDGGGVVQNNGTSTSTFFTPRYVSHSFVVTGKGGLNFLLGPRVSVNFEVYGSGLVNSLKRNFDIAATVGWRL